MVGTFFASSNLMEGASMADYLDFPDIFSRIPNWSFVLAALGILGLVLRFALRSVKMVLAISFCVLMIYLVFNVT